MNQRLVFEPTKKKKGRNLNIFNFNYFHIAQLQYESKLVHNYKTYCACNLLLEMSKI